MIKMPLTQPWLPFGDGSADVSARMYCLPFAGGGASNFAAWRKLHPAIGVGPIQYPGHETRLAEPPVRSMKEMVGQIADVIAARLDRPYLLFGYSMGARIAFALIHNLVARGLPAPAALIVAAHRPPDRISNALHAADLPDAELKEVLRNYGGMPAELLDDDDFCAMILPVMRADFAMAAHAVELAPIDCPIIAYAGAQDTKASAEDMKGWAMFTTGAFHLKEFAGGHFFLRTAPDFEARLKADMAASLSLTPEHLVSD